MPGLFLDSDLNLTHPFSRDEPEGSDHIPLAPVISSAGGLTLKNHHGIGSSLRYRYLGDRPANEYNTTTAKGYMLTDLVINYSRHRYEVGFSIQNLFNVYWNEAQFDTESRLYDESSPVSEIHFTPGGPRLVKLQLAFFW
ncbi:MAG TPA: TonB-dependent receptor [Cyclobacteriaceae bacterium]